MRPFGSARISGVVTSGSRAAVGNGAVIVRGRLHQRAGNDEGRDSPALAQINSVRRASGRADDSCRAARRHISRLRRRCRGHDGRCRLRRGILVHINAPGQAKKNQRQQEGDSHSDVSFSCEKRRVPVCSVPWPVRAGTVAGCWPTDHERVLIVGEWDCGDGWIRDCRIYTLTIHPSPPSGRGRAVIHQHTVAGSQQTHACSGWVRYGVLDVD
jgi:hypothetical protein